MATFGIKVFKHHEKKDGTFNVKIRITHDRKTAYIDTHHYVVRKMLSKSYQVKDTLILKELYYTIETYREAVSRLGPKLDYLTSDDIKNYLEKSSEKVDFLLFCQKHIDTLMENGRIKTATGFRTVRYAIIDFFGNRPLPADEITPNFLISFEKFLRSPRQIIRFNQFGKQVITKSSGLTDAGIHNYMHDVRTLFNAAQAYYNRPSLGIIAIPFNPFKEYKLPELAETRKRNLTLDQLKKFIQYKAASSGRVRLSYDLFLLSIYMCGMNAVDFYNCNFKINNGRLEYERSKTKGKRKDRAFISIKVVGAAQELIEKYRDKLTIEYSGIGNLNKALNVGLKVIGEAIGVPDLSFYWARHTFGNLARNKCRKSKDDVALALNHVDHGRRTTDIYLQKDWAIVDEVQEAVINLLEPINIQLNVNTFSVILDKINLPSLIKQKVLENEQSGSITNSTYITVSDVSEAKRKEMRLVRSDYSLE